MIIVKFYRKDLVTGEPTIELDWTVIPSTADAQEQHEWAVDFASRRANAVAYQLFEGDNLRSLQPISLTHALD